MWFSSICMCCACGKFITCEGLTTVNKENEFNVLLQNTAIRA